jgi:hypothetical protein
MVERAEAQRTLLAVVLELDEPYRSTVLARYAQGESSAAIARRTGVNESTVRTRLARAQEQLRERLGRGSSGLAALAPLLDGTATGTLVKLGAGAGIMGLALKAGVVAAGVVCAWATWRACTPRETPLVLSTPTEERVPRETLEAADLPVSARTPLAAVEPPPPAGTTAAPQSVPAAGADAKTTLDLTVLRDLVPAAGVRLWIAPANEWLIEDCLDVRARPPANARRLDTDRYGSAVFTGLDPQVYNYRVGIATGVAPDVPSRFVTTELYPGHKYKLRLGTARVEGRAFDALGRERAGAGVQVYGARPDAEHFYFAAHAVVDARGEFTVGDLAAGNYLAILEPDGHFDGRGEVVRIPIELREGEVRTVDFGSPSPAPRWTGRVLNAFGEPFWSGSIHLTNERDGRQISGPVDDEGRFELAIAPGSWNVTARVAGAPGEGFAFGVRELAARDLESDLVVRGTRLVIRLIEPDPETGVKRSRRREDPLAISVRPEGHDYPSAFRDTRLQQDGRRVIDGLEPGRWQVTVHPGAFREGEPVIVTIAAGESVVETELHWTIR